MQRGLFDLDLGFQFRGAAFPQNPLPKPIPIDITRMQIMAGYLHQNMTKYWHHILKYFRDYRQFTNKARLYFMLITAYSYKVQHDNNVVINIISLFKTVSTAQIRLPSSS